VLATGGFAAASVAADAAPGIGWLVAARVVQGGLGAVLFALTPALATTAVRPEVRGRAMGLIATVGPVGAVSGPALGGLAVETVTGTTR
jgi:MFS family permease